MQHNAPRNFSDAASRSQVFRCFSSGCVRGRNRWCGCATRPICFHIESKYEVKYGSSVRPLFRPVFFPCHRFAKKPFYHDAAISYINIAPAALREIRQVDGVRGKGLRIFRYYSASPCEHYRFDGTIKSSYPHMEHVPRLIFPSLSVHQPTKDHRRLRRQFRGS